MGPNATQDDPALGGLGDIMECKGTFAFSEDQLSPTRRTPGAWFVLVMSEKEKSSLHHVGLAF